MPDNKKASKVTVDAGIMEELAEAYRSYLFYREILEKIEDNELARNIHAEAFDDNSKHIDCLLQLLMKEFKPSLFD